MPSPAGRLLARLGQLRPGSGVVVSDQNVVVTLASDSTVHAFSATCTHQGCTVDAVQNGVITCPCHGSRFDARTGAVLTGPAPRPLPAVAVVVRNGGVYTR
ncbi:MAG TPA: Rieske (2Fe-2S) protein [Acidimicrobiales bacterium]|nr:Rieske (2Fe-2S) protein [Acidimicrobiales bacterium]